MLNTIPILAKSLFVLQLAYKYHNHVREEIKNDRIKTEYYLDFLDKALLCSDLNKVGLHVTNIAIISTTAVWRRCSLVQMLRMMLDYC